MNNSGRFIRAFTKIEENLKRSLKRTDLTFYNLIDEAKKSNSIVRRYEYDLRQMGNLRNAILHQWREDCIIAEPNDWAVTTIEFIDTALSEPPKIYPAFKAQVMYCRMDDHISKPLEIVYKEDFSQFPVYIGDKFVRILTVNMISRWLGGNIKEGLVDLDTKVEVVLSFTDDEKNYRFLPQYKSVYDAIELFADYQRKGKHLEAIFIGSKNQPPGNLLGIMTSWDLPKAHSMIALPR